MKKLSISSILLIMSIVLLFPILTVSPASAATHSEDSAQVKFVGKMPVTPQTHKIGTTIIGQGVPPTNGQLQKVDTVVPKVNPEQNVESPGDVQTGVTQPLNMKYAMILATIGLIVASISLYFWNSRKEYTKN